LKEVIAAAIGAILSAIAGYFVARRQANKQRQEEQCYRIYISLRSVEDLASARFNKLPEAQWIDLFSREREIIFRNLVRSDLPQMEEVIRALNGIGFPDNESHHEELHRLSVAVLRHLDPRYADIYDRLKKEFAPLNEGQTLEQLRTANKNKAT
jgi:hypothetical protein